MTTNNNNQPLRTYDKKFAGMIPTIFSAKAYFAEVFGALQALDGVQNNKTAFSVKTNDVPVVIGTYNTDKNVGFGTGTSSSSRFGQRKEIIYEDVDIDYDDTWAFHEGLDKYTVNTDLQAAVAERLGLQAQALTRKFSKKHGAYLVTHASKDLGDTTDIKKLFNAASSEYVQLEVDVPIIAYVTSAIYNAIVDLPETTTAKQSTVSIENNRVAKYKGFTIKEIPDAYLAGAQVIFAPYGIGRAFTGIVTTRAIASEDFDGMALQGAGKSGQWIGDDNLKAVFTAGATGQATSLTLSQKTATMTVGATKTIMADSDVTWDSSDDTVATVSTDGVITAVAAGSATITATTTDGSNLVQEVAVTVNAA